MTYQRGWATTSTVSGAHPGDSQRVEVSFATGPAHALAPGTGFAPCDESIRIVDSTVREGWPPRLGDICPVCRAIGEQLL